MTSPKIALAASDAKTAFAVLPNVILYINVEQEDGVMMAYVEITIIAARITLIVALTTTAILTQNNVHNVHALIIRNVAMALVVLMVGVFRAKHSPANLVVALPVGIVSKGIVVSKDVYMIMIALVAFIVIPQQSSVSLAFKRNYLENAEITLIVAPEKYV